MPHAATHNETRRSAPSATYLAARLKRDHPDITIHGADNPEGVMNELHWNTKRLWPMQTHRNTTTAAS
jgi:hypothetical protein